MMSKLTSAEVRGRVIVVESGDEKTRAEHFRRIIVKKNREAYAWEGCVVEKGNVQAR